MKILLVCVPNEGSTAWYLKRGFEKIGCEVNVFNYKKAPRWVTFQKFSLPLGKNISVKKVIRELDLNPIWSFNSMVLPIV